MKYRALYLIKELSILIIELSNSNRELSNSIKELSNTRGGSRTSTAGGAQVTNEAEGFTEARSAEKGRVGEEVTPSRRWGSGGPPPEIFWEIASKWCILSAFSGNQYTFLHWKFIWTKCVSLIIYI